MESYGKFGVGKKNEQGVGKSMNKSTRKGQNEVHCFKTQESGVAKRNICVGQFESHAGQVVVAMQDEHGQVQAGGDDGDSDGVKYRGSHIAWELVN